MKISRFVTLLGALTVMFAGAGCVADGSYYGGGGGYYGGGYGPGYYGAPGPVVVEGGPVYRETVVVDNTRYRHRDGGYYRGRRPAPYASSYRRGGYSRRGPVVAERRGSGQRKPSPVYHRTSNKKEHGR